MSVTVANVGGTMTGGTSVALTYQGNLNAGKAVFTTPAHTRLAPRQVDFLVTQAVTTSKDPGVGRGGVKITYGDRATEEGCCTVQQGSVIIDVGVRWPLNQPESLVDDAIDMLQALMFNAAFLDAVKKGVTPA
jgi:hypothetical protein